MACLAIGLAILVSLAAPIRAEEARVVPEEAGVAPITGMQIEPQGVPTASSKAPAGLLPIPDYSANIWTREHLTGDWLGARSYLANKGVQIGVELNQYVQGVTNGGRDRTAAYGGTADYTVNVDLMRMGILPGALIKFPPNLASAVRLTARLVRSSLSTRTFCSLSVPNSMRTFPSRSLTSIIPSSFRPIWAFSSVRSTRSMAIRTSSLPAVEPANS